jgi:adenylate cyclase
MAAWTCASCGGDNPEGTRFCGHCGALASTEWTCSSCGNANPGGTRFCGHCGAAADAAGAVSSPEQGLAPPKVEADITQALRSFVVGQVADRLVETGGRLPEERRLITALFADVSGFTTLADRLDPEQLLEVIDPVISGLSSVVGRYDGYVEKFAGDALLALFGAPTSHEDDAERALLVALEMHRELERLCRELPHQAELTLHVGVNSGHGIARILGSEARMDYAVLGDSVILAQRLESAAPPGETYVSELTMRLTKERFDFEPIGDLTLKGKAEPVPAWRLLGERQRAVARSAGRTISPLVGREREFLEAAGVITALAAGGGAVLTLTGEPGVGKSRLTTAVRDQVRAENCAWLETRCLSYGGSNAYWPYAELLRVFADVRFEDHPTTAAEKLKAALERVDAADAAPFFAHLLALPPNGEANARELEPEAFRRGLHRAFASWVRAVARQRPTVIAIEDIHWADASTLALTGDLARLCVAEPVVLYLIARPEAEQTLRELAPLRRAIRLEPLGEAAVAQLMESVLGGSTPPDVLSFVMMRTAGNPLFVEELVRTLRDTGAVSAAGGTWSLRPGWDARQLPPTIEGVLSARIDLLDRRAAGVLQTAAVIGRRVRLPLLEAVADEPDLNSAVRELVERGFLDPWSEDGGEAAVAFHHALIQDVAYSRLLRRRSRDLHRRVADEAERLYGSGDDVIDLLARHLYLGAAGVKAIEYLVRAGERAKRLFANAEAILHLSRAVDVATGDLALAERVAAIELSLADLHELIGNYDEALGLYTKVKDQTNSVESWRGIASTLRKRGEYDRALETVHAAFATDALRDADLTPLWLEQGWTLSVAGRFQQAIDVLQAGLAAAGTRREPVVGQLLLQLARAETFDGDYESALEHVSAAQAIFEENDDLRGLATALRILGDVYSQAGRLGEAADALRRGLEVAERVGSAEEIGGCLINLGFAEYRRGQLHQAIAHDRRAVEEFERIGHGSGRARAYTNLADKLAQAGDFDEALLWCSKALELSRSIGHSLTIADVYDTMGFIYLQRGEFANAAARAEQAVALYLEMGAAPQAATTLGLAAEAWEKDGDDERARDARARARSLTPSSAVS